MTINMTMHLCTQWLRTDLEDREARLRAQEEEMQQRDTEISRLLGEFTVKNEWSF